MLHFSVQMDESFRESLGQKLEANSRDTDITDGITLYLFTGATLMERMVEGLRMLVTPPDSEGVTGPIIIRGILKIFSLFRQNMEKWDGIVSHYILNMGVSGVATENQPLQVEGVAHLHEGLSGVFQSLVNFGLAQEVIDTYYIDGNLLEIYDICMESLITLDFLVKTKKPGSGDFRDTLIMLETRWRELFQRLFVDKFDDASGFYECLEKALTHIEKRKGEKA